MKLIALCGAAGAGKDTVADMLPARKLAFADTLYAEVAAAWDVEQHVLRCRETKETEQERLTIEWCSDYDFRVWFFHQPVASASREPWDTTPRSPRQILQWWGDYRRAQDPDYFVEALSTAFWYTQAGDVHGEYIITDVRFPNEAAMVRQLGGQIWQIRRPGYEAGGTGHASDTAGGEFAPDLIVTNGGSLEELRATVLAAWHDAR